MNLLKTALFRSLLRFKQGTCPQHIRPGTWVLASIHAVHRKPLGFFVRQRAEDRETFPGRTKPHLLREGIIGFKRKTSSDTWAGLFQLPS